MKYDQPFYIGGLNIYGYQRSTGFRRWNTMRAARKCNPQLTECPRCQNNIADCDGVFATLQKRNQNESR